MALLSELFVNALWRGKQFDKGAKGSSKQVKAFEKTIDNAKVGLSAFRSVLGAVGVGLSVDFFRSVVQGQAANIRFAETLGLSTRQLEAYQAGAKRFGVSQEIMNDALLELSRRSAEAKAGTGSLKDTLDFLNLDVDKFLRMPLADRFALLTERFSKLDDSTRNFLADESFGGAADAISGILPEISKVADEFERAGLGTSPEAADRFKKLDEQFAVLSKRLELVGKQFIVDISPNVLRALDAIEFITRNRPLTDIERQDPLITRRINRARTPAELQQARRTEVGPEQTITARDWALIRAVRGNSDRQLLN